jgi:hypothetical protein
MLASFRSRQSNRRHLPPLDPRGHTRYLFLNKIYSNFSYNHGFIKQKGQPEDEIQRNGVIIITAFFLFLVIEKVTELVPNAHALGTLNLVANFLDNTAHGTSVVGAFQNSFKVSFDRFGYLRFFLFIFTVIYF